MFSKAARKNKINKASKISLESIMPEESLGTSSDILNDKKDKKREQYKLLSLYLASLVFFIGGAYTYYTYSVNTAQVRQQLTYVSDIKRLTEKVEKNAYLAQGAKKSAFSELSESKNSIDSILNVLNMGGKVQELDTEVKPVSEQARGDFEKTKSNWNENKPLLNTLVEQGKNLVELRTLIEKAVENNQRVIDSSFSLQKSISKLGNSKYDNITQEIIFSINKISGINTDLFSGENFTLTNGYALVKDIKSISFYLNLLRTGSEVYDIAPVTDEESLEQIKLLESAFSSYSTIVSKIVENVPVLNSAKELSKTIAKDAAKINIETSQLDGVLKKELDKNNFYQIASLIFFTLLAASIAALSVVFYKERNKAVKYAGQLKKNQANEQAVENLLRQMSPIEIGDLTQSISVADKFIEPIANRVNKNRELLRNLINEVKKASHKLSSSAMAATSISTQVLKGADAQFKVMENSIDQIGKITSEMDEVAQNSWIAKEEAIKSETVSKQGLLTVNSSISKMNEIRDNIQESAKKIKRLGESSQAIVSVTDLIRNITKEINVLAFNAAIQATTAGEGGKAFSVMAQEVQRLAESSAAASKQIDELIKEIQQDTAIAVAAMEQTTQQVVDGTQLNDSAGKILQQIADSSEELARTISSVAESIETKSNEMVTVSLQVRELQEVNNVSIEQVKNSVSKVDEITQSSSTLSKSVDSYKVE